MTHYRCKWVAVAAAVALAAGSVFAADQKLELQKGNHISFIGNALGDQMQHHGWLETLIESRFPGQEISIRDLAVSGDEVNLKDRIRSKNFGTPDHWLTKTKADVVFLFFGYNE